MRRPPEGFMGMFRRSPAEAAPAPAEPKERNVIAETGERIRRLENTLAAIMFAESKKLSPAQERWVRDARAKMTDAERKAFPNMSLDAIYPLASELHKRTQEDSATRYASDRRLAA